MTHDTRRAVLSRAVHAHVPRPVRARCRRPIRGGPGAARRTSSADVTSLHRTALHAVRRSSARAAPARRPRGRRTGADTSVVTRRHRHRALVLRRTAPQRGRTPRPPRRRNIPCRSSCAACGGLPWVEQPDARMAAPPAGSGQPQRRRRAPGRPANLHQQRCKTCRRPGAGSCHPPRRGPGRGPACRRRRRSTVQPLASHCGSDAGTDRSAVTSPPPPLASRAQPGRPRRRPPPATVHGTAQRCGLHVHAARVKGMRPARGLPARPPRTG
jgi:hypothetical protein